MVFSSVMKEGKKLESPDVVSYIILTLALRLKISLGLSTLSIQEHGLTPKADSRLVFRVHAVPVTARPSRVNAELQKELRPRRIRTANAPTRLRSVHNQN